MMNDTQKKPGDVWYRLLFVLVVAMCALATAVNTGIVLYQQSRITTTQGRLEAENTARRQLEMCLTTWANATTERSAALFGASQARQKALDALIAAVATNNRERFAHALSRYERIAHHYNAEAKAHPVPPAPLFLCDQ